MILEENDLDQYINGEVPEPEGDKAKATHKKNLAKAKRIIAYFIKDHLIIQDTKGSIWFFDKYVWRKEHQPKYDFEEPVEECEDRELWYYIVLLHKGCSNRRTTSSSWRKCQRRRNCNDYLEWSP